MQDGEGLVDGSQSVGAGMELGADLAQRKIDLWGQDEDDERRLEVHRPREQTQTDGDRDQRDGQRGEQLEDHRRQERNAQGRVGRPPVRVAQGPHPGGRPTLTPERDQRWQACQQVDDLRAQTLHRGQAPGGGLLRHPPDQRHEQRHQRQSGSNDQRRQQVVDRHDQQHHGGHDSGQEQLREVAREVRAQVLQPDTDQRQHARPLV